MNKLRLTGGEPLVRRDVMKLFRSLGRHLETGALNELTLTTNGSQLARFAAELVDCGVKRINVSLDTLDRESSAPSPAGAILRVLSRRRCGAGGGLKDQDQCGRAPGVNDDEIPDLIEWAHGRGMDMTLIETMPMGDVDADRTEQYLPLSLVRADLREALHAGSERRAHRRTGALCPRRAKPADGSASSRRCPTISAKSAIACG